MNQPKSVTFYVMDTRSRIVWSTTREGVKAPKRTKLYKHLPHLATAYGCNRYGFRFNY
jgi:hypothetical protein